MNKFTLHTLESAPKKSQEMLKSAEKQMGAIPNLYAVMAESPEIYQGYNTLHSLFTETSFDDEELTVVWQTINVEHECHYCVPAHSAIANSMKVDSTITEALRNETTLPTDKLEALRDFTLAMVRERGEVSDDTLNAFYQAGYSQKQVLEIILGLSQKVISNYVNHVAKTPIDAMFKDFSWEKNKQS